MKILVLNAGSSSQKSCLYELNDTQPDRPLQPLWEAKIDWTHQQGVSELKVKTAKGTQFEEEFASESRTDTISRMLETLWKGETQTINDLNEIDIVGHRVVHGGQDYQESTLISPDVKKAIARLAVFAPVHNPVNLEGIEAIENLLPNVPQIAVFDTAFHAQLPPAAFVYPGPYEWLENGIRRYGFHGISHQYCARRAAEMLNRNLADLRLISCHLGNGCSLAAIRGGVSIDTTMGFTPLEGLMMGSRSGSIDPGIIIHLLRRSDITAEKLDNILNQNSGLKGISGVSGDMRQIGEAISQGNERAQLALDIYIHRLRAGIGAMLASLGGLDALIFTAGVGENSAFVRATACEAFGFMGLKLDGEKNQQVQGDEDIATADSAVRVLVIHTQEDWEIARECWKFY
ncbi:MAG: acetate kinase [Tychonema bourrellyi B0820]|uniref:Acetate kinase n=1 Tax=Tychonema bourrellyi FEM_GT703 TaxID=2040638 RepID=A0A2G4F0V1_9CYAN|nr:acetate kinase [Tychonema bourrellyi]MDQ2098032.1 acetate kinase [Tychonema bourrellyi B0820]PHX55390.1 acetate kinase [Tychonema bourrellyi FEM_GT703]